MTFWSRKHWALPPISVTDLVRTQTQNQTWLRGVLSSRRKAVFQDLYNVTLHVIVKYVRKNGYTQVM